MNSLMQNSLLLKVLKTIMNVFAFNDFEELCSIIQQESKAVIDKPSFI